jgi:heptosyltransferase-1
MSAAPRHVLVIRLSAIGDVVNTLPAVTLLRHALPDAVLGFVVEDRARDVVIGHPLVDRVYVFPRKRWREMLRRPARWGALAREIRDWVRTLRDIRWDVALDVQSNLKGAAFAFASGAARRIGFARGHDYELNHLLSTEQVVPPADHPHRVDKFASLAGAIGVSGDAREYVLPVDDGARARIAVWCDRQALAPRSFVVLHPGTSDHGAEKRWPPESFAALARAIGSDLQRPVVVTWGPGEEALAERVCTLSDGAARLGPATASLLELVELLRLAAVFVSADTGPMHLAAASGVPCVALFGPKDPAVYGPYGAGHVVLRPPAGSRVTADIAVDTVRAAVADRVGVT